MQSVSMCPEFLREAIALGYGKQSLVYAVLHGLSRAGSGLMMETDIIAFVANLIDVQPRTIERHYLPSGDGIFWRRNHGKVALIAPEKVAAHIAEISIKHGRLDVLETNPPGTKFIEIPLADSLNGWYGNVLAAWHNSRADHTTNISRFTLERLFNKSTPTLIQWEKAASIKIVECYAVYTDVNQSPEYSYATLHYSEDKHVVQRSTARHSNIYNAPTMREVQHHKTPRRMREAVRKVIENNTFIGNPDGIYGLMASQSPEVGLQSTGRRNFSHSTGKNGFKSGFKKVINHLKHHGDYSVPHFVELGFDNRLRRWMYEQSTGIQHSYIGDRLPINLERGILCNFA